MLKPLFKNKADKFIFWILLAVYSAVMLYLFVNECLEVPHFTSDMHAYINKVAGIKDEYEYPYPLLFWAAKLFSLVSSPAIGMAIATMLLNSAGVVCAKYYFTRLSERFDIQSDKSDGTVQILLTVSVYILFLVSNLYGPLNRTFFGFDYIYRMKGIYTPNPFWNATYLATRPFAIICFFAGTELIIRIRELSASGNGGKLTYRECIPFAASLFLTTFTKPSFTMIFVPSVGIVLLCILISGKGKAFRNIVVLCITMIPTAIDLCYQFFGVFSGVNAKGEETGVAFGFLKMWGYFSNNIPLSIAMGMALPIGVLILNLIFDGENVAGNPYYRFAWLNYIVSAIMMACLYEKGFRLLHANFSWGYMHGMFFVFMLTIYIVVKNTIEWCRSYKIVFVLAEWGVLLFHLSCGVNFLIYALRGLPLEEFG